MKPFTYIGLCSSLCTAVAAHPFSPSSHDGSGLVKRADPSLVGYLGAFFHDSDPSVFFYLSDGNDALSFRPLKGEDPILVPTTGTGGVRDPTLVNGGGDETGLKWYVIGTDLDIAKTTWDEAARRGSRGIFIWESTDLVNWSEERLVELEDETAGMVWAPEAFWDEEQGQYFVFWSSRFFSPDDPNHEGESSLDMIRYSYTSDFTTFTAPETYVDYTPTTLIDLNFLPLGGSSYVRFLKNETDLTVFTEISDSGLFGTWRIPENAADPAGVIGGKGDDLAVEGPWAYWDNEVEGKAYVLLDFYGAGLGYAPLESTDVEGGVWEKSATSSFPEGLKHGSVISVDQERYDALELV